MKIAHRLRPGVGKVRLDAFEELQDHLGLARTVPLVVLPENLIRARIDHHGLDGRRADVDADKQPLRPLLGRLETLAVTGRHLLGPSHERMIGAGVQAALRSHIRPARVVARRLLDLPILYFFNSHG